MSAVRMKAAGIIIALAMLGAFAMLLFPPWQLDLHSRTGAEIGTEFRYAPLWMPPQEKYASVRLAVALLVAQIAVLLLTVATSLLVASKIPLEPQTWKRLYETVLTACRTVRPAAFYGIALYMLFLPALLEFPLELQTAPIVTESNTTLRFQSLAERKRPTTDPSVTDKAGAGKPTMKLKDLPPEVQNAYRVWKSGGDPLAYADSTGEIGAIYEWSNILLDSEDVVADPIAAADEDGAEKPMSIKQEDLTPELLNLGLDIEDGVTDPIAAADQRGDLGEIYRYAKTRKVPDSAKFLAEQNLSREELNEVARLNLGGKKLPFIRPWRIGDTDSRIAYKAFLWMLLWIAPLFVLLLFDRISGATRSVGSPSK